MPTQVTYQNTYVNIDRQSCKVTRTFSENWNIISIIRSRRIRWPENAEQNQEMRNSKLYVGETSRFIREIKVASHQWQKYSRTLHNRP